MLSDDDHPGLFTFMVGLIVLVMAGVALSLLIDRRFHFSSGKVALEAAIAQDAKVLRDLRLQHAVRARELAALAASRGELAACYEAAADRLGQGREDLAWLTATRAALARQVAALEQEFARYRDAYRRKEWAAAAGQKIPLLKVRNGREYRDATILRVTEVGLEIRYADGNGLSRIEAPDLGDEWQERFQWNDEERRAKLAQERRDQETVGAEPN